MTSQAAINNFFAQKSVAVVGVSRDPKKFGNAIYRELKTKGYKVFAINPGATSIEGEPCYASLAALPEKVGAVVIVTPPAAAEKVVNEASAAGIQNVWLQQGAQTPAAVQAGQKNGQSVISGECVLMYAPNAASFHKFHKFLKELFGGKPK